MRAFRCLSAVSRRPAPMLRVAAKARHEWMDSAPKMTATATAPAATIARFYSIGSHHSPTPPSRSLQGRVAIVTGAGCAGDGIGNGRAISILLADDGCHVICVDSNLEWAEKTASMAAAGCRTWSSHMEQDQSQGHGQTSCRGQVVATRGDVTVDADCQAAVDLALSRFGRLDILVNNVGVAGAPGTAIEVDMDKWARSLDINVSSMVRMAKYAVPAMINSPVTAEDGATTTDADQPRNRVIVNMGSVAGLRGGTPHLLYPTSKGAVVNMTRAMAAHHAPAGIRVNCVCPGMLYTPMMYAACDASGNTVAMSDAARQARKARSLLGTEGNAWDAAAAAVFLASDHARWLTGVVLPVDAGVTAAVGIGMPKNASVNG